MWSFLSIVRPLRIPIPMSKKKIGFNKKSHRNLLIVYVYCQPNSCTTHAEHEWAGRTFLRQQKKVPPAHAQRVFIYWYDNSDRVNNVTIIVTMHLCSEILSLKLFLLLPPLATVIVAIIHLMIITSPALPFWARSNPATPSSQSQWQIVSFGGGLVGAQHWDPLAESQPSSTCDCWWFVGYCFPCTSRAPSARSDAPWQGRGGGPPW
jgi:hypothetical protein